MTEDTAMDGASIEEEVAASIAHLERAERDGMSRSEMDEWWEGLGFVLDNNPAIQDRLVGVVWQTFSIKFLLLLI